MITIYNKKGKKCSCELSQLKQMLKKGFTQNLLKAKSKAESKSDSVPTSGPSNPNKKTK